MSIPKEIADFTHAQMAQMVQLGKELGLEPVKQEQAVELTKLRRTVDDLSIGQMRVSITLDGTDGTAKQLMSNIIAINDGACHGHKFQANKHLRAEPRHEHTIKGKTYSFQTAVTRAHAKSLIHHGYNVLAEDDAEA